MSAATRRRLLLAIVPLFAAVVMLQARQNPVIREMRGRERTPLIGLSTEFILGPMLGLGQAVAGLLWVRADEFFHEGDYDAILPLVRMITWLDPHQLDVYITGAWHLAYNFTDSGHRSDRRYIPPAQALLREGFHNNPTVYDIAFELGWQNSDKVRNFHEAEQWFREATVRSTTDEQGRKQPPPMFTWHQLAHSLARQGLIDESIATWRHVLSLTDAQLKEARERNDPQAWSLANVRANQLHNLTLTLKRKFSRFTHEIDFVVDGKQTKSIDMQTGRPSPPNAYLATRPNEGVPIGQPRLPALAREWETAFDARVTFPEPMVMEPRGDFAMGDGARVTIRLHDYDWRPTQLEEFTFRVDQTQTIMIDQHSVRNYAWGRTIDMSRDPKMYSFTRPEYFLVFEFDPRGTSPFIQDRTGWCGEGMTDRRFLVVKRQSNPNSPPVRLIRKVFRLTRDHILNGAPVTDADIVPNADYSRIMGEVVLSPTRRAGLAP
ncbi:MAG TPA: hypothetical protein VLH79_00340 [Chthonomonadales bacterium]|nr:hypothetical protein [Chthonomonadales bacterium]